jgi:1,4-alpha-glucan branching enzyme
MSLKKHYIKSKPVCKVTFILSDDQAAYANNVNLTGDFNNWDVKSIPMKKVKKSKFTTCLELEKGKEYQYKYIIDGKEWVNDVGADKFVINEFRSENSVLIVEPI